MDLKAGDVYECPEGHNAKIVWISENKNTIAVKCSHEYFESSESGYPNKIKIAIQKPRY